MGAALHPTGGRPAARTRAGARREPGRHRRVLRRRTEVRVASMAWGRRGRSSPDRDALTVCRPAQPRGRRSGADSRHGARWGRQIPAAVALVPAALAAAGHGEAEHQDEQDRGDDEQDAPHGPPPCPYLHLCAGEPGAPKLFPASAFGSKLLRARALWRSRLALSSTLRRDRGISLILIGWPSRGVVSG